MLAPFSIEGASSKVWAVHIVNLRWDWLIEHKPLKTVVFDIPRLFVKVNRPDF